MEASWLKLIEDLGSFPGTELELKAASGLDGDVGAKILVLLTPGDAFESPRLEVSIVTDARGTCVELMNASGIPEDVVDAVLEAGRSVANRTGPLAMRSALLRLCSELYVELRHEQSAALSVLGRSDAVRKASRTSEEGAPAGPLPLLRDVSRATSGGMSIMSFESGASLGPCEDYVFSEESLPVKSSARKEEHGPAGGAARPAQSCFAGLSRPGPAVEEVCTWTAAVDGLKRFPDALLELTSSGCWNGEEGLLELVFNAPEGFEWERLQVVIIISGHKPTSVQLKGAQVVPTTVAYAIAEVNRYGQMGTGPASIRTAVRDICCALCLELSERQQDFLEVLGDRSRIAGILMYGKLQESSGYPELQREQQAVEALKVQHNLIEYQILHLENRLGSELSILPELQHELGRLRRSLAEVAAEHKAASAAVQALFLEMTDTTGTVATTKVLLHLQDLPAQSLRGHGPQGAAALLQQALERSGPWGHYAAFQFETMLTREQELHSNFLCFYHSYSIAALLYEVQGAVARHLFQLPPDSPPLPRLLVSSAGACTDLEALRKKGGQDHDSSFRALGLSSSCSVFASGSEAPPLTCFQGGYSCTDVPFRELLEKFLTTCSGSKKEGNALADAVVAVGRKHNLPVSVYDTSSAPILAPGSGALTGYMLQIFVHRSVANKFVYPSKPMGTPIKGSILKYVEQDGSMADGQARILFHPKTFLDASHARLYHYCARPLQSCMSAEVEGSRGRLLVDLRKALCPLLETQSADAIARRLNLR